MSEEPEAPFLRIAEAISDETPVDWEALRAESPHLQSKLERLQALEAVAIAHRQAAGQEHAGQGAAAQAASSPPERAPLFLWGSLRVLEKLAEGGFGEVFRAWDPTLEREVALKLRRVEAHGLDRSARRWLDEARRLARVRHPNVLVVHGADVHEGLAGFWTDLLEGRTLETLLAEQGPMSAEEATVVGLDLCRALAAVHAAGLVHGDVKTSNVMREGASVRPEGTSGSGRIVLMDFGAAHERSHVGGDAPSFGTPLTSAPEVLEGKAPTPASDLYSLGVLLYRLVTGCYPLEAKSLDELRERLARGERPALREARPDLPTGFVQVVERALVHDPAARFADTGDMERALAAALGVAEGTLRREPGARVHRGRLPLAIAGIVIALAAAMGLWRAAPLFRRPLGSEVVKQDWVLVAEFDAPLDDPDLATPTRDLVTAALDQSGIVATVPRDQVQSALRLAGKPDTTRISADLARELAYRSSVRAVIEGRISRLGAGYSIVLRVVDVEDGNVVVSVSDVANRKEALIASVERITRRLREGLGERRSAIQASRPLTQVMTPSFEAFRKYVKAGDLWRKGDWLGMLSLHRTAVALDPDFAAAWSSMGTAFTILGQQDSARVAYGEALRRPGRLSDTGQLMIEASLATLENDLPAALAFYDQILQREPSSMGALNNRAVVLSRAGRYAEALAGFERAAQLGPFGPNQNALGNQFLHLVALGRLDQARQVARGLKGGFGQLAPVGVALAADEWAVAESLGSALESAPIASSYVRPLAARAVSSALATRGAVRAAAQALRRAQDYAEAAGASLWVQQALRDRLLLALVSGAAVGREGASGRDTSTAALITRGLWAVAAGDAGRARHLLDTIRMRPPDELARQGASPALLQAWIAASAHRWDESIRILGPAARQGAEPGFVPLPAGRVTMRWLIADAFQRSGRLDSAAVYFEMTSSPLDLIEQALLSHGIVFSFAHQRLVLLYARMGRLEDARRHWRIFSEAFTRPDPGMGPLVEEARAALASAEGMARSARR